MTLKVLNENHKTESLYKTVEIKISLSKKMKFGVAGVSD